MGLATTIAGNVRRFKFGSLVITNSVNGRGRLTATLDILDAAARPALDDEVIVTEDGVRIFGGYVGTASHQSITADASKDLRINLGAVDYNLIADWRLVPDLTSTGGLTVKAVLQLLLPFLPGVTLHPAQLDGQVLPAFTHQYKRPSKILDEVSTIAKWPWNIDYDKRLRMWDPTSQPAPWNLIDGDRNAMGDIVVEPVSTEYANRVILRAGPNAPADHVAGWNTDGTTNSFPMYLQVLQHYGFVWVQYPAPEHSETLGPPGSGAQWIFTDGPTQTIARAAGPPPAYTVPPGGYPPAILMRYVAQFPVIVQANDAAGQAAKGLREVLVDQSDIVSIVQAQAIVDGLLPQYATRSRTVRYATRRTGLGPGQVQTIQIARRSLNGPHFITDVETRMHPTAAMLIRSVTAQEALLFTGSWRDVYRLWASAGGGGGGSISSGGGGTTPVTPAAPAYFLGASALEWQQANPVAWLPAGGVQVQPRGLSAATVRVRLRARAGSVTARLQDLTDGTTAGTSAAVTNTVLQPVTFPVLLTEGHTYELQVLPSLVDTDVQAIGYLS